MNESIKKALFFYVIRDGAIYITLLFTANFDTIVSKSIGLVHQVHGPWGLGGGSRHTTTDIHLRISTKSDVCSVFELDAAF